MIICKIEEYKIKVSDCMGKKNMYMHPSKIFLRFPVREKLQSIKKEKN